MSLKRAHLAFDTITGCSYYGMSMRVFLALDPEALAAAEKLAERLKASDNPALRDDPEQAGADALADAEKEQQRRDEKRGLYPEHEDPSN